VARVATVSADGSRKRGRVEALPRRHRTELGFAGEEPLKQRRTGSLKAHDEHRVLNRQGLDFGMQVCERLES
jgi:hypothetical protein